MEIYIEYAIIDNFIMDFLLLLSTHKILKKKPSYIRVIVTAILSTFLTIILAMFSLKPAYMTIIKLFMLLLIVLLGGKYYTFLDYFKFVNVFLLLTFFCGGIIFGIMYFLDIDYFVDKPYLKGVLPVGINVLIAVILFKVVNKISVRFFEKINRGNICCCIITAGEISIKLNALIDSGNLLLDSKTKLPIVVGGFPLIKKLKLGSPKRFLEIETANSSSKMGLYDVDNILIKIGNKSYKRDAVLGITDTFSKDFEIIIGCSLIE